ncbi:SUMF1/EgtB/PvdO family nonheme iron enzyme [Glutamicibacter creatinolyticus]|uniref:SUMF1/EgtB/PvdO family nonheme iron enzyme n=1 Tax=Glutamicibacter creatinolyticus TaxID=162496 RepID=UPI003B980D9D
MDTSYELQDRFPHGDLFAAGLSSEEISPNHFPRCGTDTARNDSLWVGTTPVGLFPPHGVGLFDMIGKVWEWTADYWIYRHLPARSPLGRLLDRHAAVT